MGGATMDMPDHLGSGGWAEAPATGGVVRRWGTSVLMVVLVAAACGDSGSEDATPSTAPSLDLPAASTTGSTTTTAAPMTTTSVAEVPADKVVLGDRVIELESVGCVGGPEVAPLRLYGFGSDQDGVQYGVRVEDYLVGVRALAEGGLVATSRFAPAWDGAAVQGAGEFRVDGGLAESLTGTLQATCPATGLDSGWAVDETGIELPLPAGLVCVDSGATFSFAAGEEFSGLHTSDREIVTYFVTRYPDAFESAELAELVDELGTDAVVELVELVGFGEGGVLAGHETALLMPAQPSPIFNTPIPADRFSITADLDYVDRLRANPRLQQQVDEIIEGYGETATVEMEVTCAVSLKGPPGATVVDISGG